MVEISKMALFGKNWTKFGLNLAGIAGNPGITYNYVRIDVPFEKWPLSQYERCYEKIKVMVSIVEVEIFGFLQFPK